jgi:hypothetical protein
MTTDSSKRKQALEEKALGNTAFQANKFEEALKHFTRAIELDPTDHIFFSNRSGAYASLNRYAEALGDGCTCVALKPDWWKGYSRKGNAEFHLGRLDEAEKTFCEGLRLQADEAALKDALAMVRAKKGDDPQKQSSLPVPQPASSAQKAQAKPVDTQEPTSPVDLTKLTAAQMRQRLELRYQSMSDADLDAHILESGLDSSTCKDRVAKIALLLDAPKPSTGSSGASSSGCGCFASKKYKSPGERHLEQRRKLLDKWRLWDEDKLHKKLHKLGIESSGCKNRDDLLDMLLAAELKRQDEQKNPQRYQTIGLACASICVLGAFAGTVCFLLLAGD